MAANIRAKQLRDGELTEAKLETTFEQSLIRTDGSQAFSSDQPMGSNKLTGLADGTATGDAVNLGQLQAQQAGLAWKDAVLTSDVDLSAATISYSDPTLTISVLTAGSALGLLDGIEPVVGSRVLIRDAANAGTGADAAMNGLWEITGGTTTTLTMTRTTDMDAAGEFSSAAVFVQQGTVAGDTGWVQTAEITTVDTDSVVWSQFTGGAVLTAGDGIDIAANVVSVDLKTSGGLKIDTTELAVEPADFAGTGLEDDGADNLRLATQGNGIAGGNGSTLSVDANGTSIDVSASGVKAAVPVKSDKAQVSGVTSGDGSTTTLTITSTPGGGGYVQVLLNGVQAELGDAVKTKDCYFSADTGTTAKAIGSIVATDVLYWNGVVVGFDLDANDILDFNYNVA